MAQPAADPAGIARKALDLLLGEKYPELSQMFTPDLQKAFPQAELGKLVATQIKPLGAVQGFGDPSVRKAGANSVVVIPVKFAGGASVNFQAAINAGGLVNIMNLLPGEVSW